MVSLLALAQPYVVLGPCWVTLRQMIQNKYLILLGLRLRQGSRTVLNGLPCAPFLPQELVYNDAWGKDKKVQGYRTGRYSATGRRYFWTLLGNAASAAIGNKNLWHERPSLIEREWRDGQRSPSQMDSQTVSRERWPVRQS